MARESAAPAEVVEDDAWDLDQTMPVPRQGSQRPPRYREIGLIATGGSGEVVECQDQVLGRRVALKTARRDADRDEETEAMLAREARLTGQLEHPNIIPVYDAGADQAGGRYYVMRLLDHPSLEVVLGLIEEGDPDTLGRFPIGRLLNDFMQICRAVDYANSRGIIHCDLKPANILLGAYGEVLVVDWGMAFDQRDRTGFRGGTPGYMAPEQLDPRCTEYDARTDVFALGAILYEILSLRPPFDGETVDEVLSATHAYLGGQVLPRPARLRGLACPREVEEICLRALEALPDRRFTTAGDMARAIEAVLFGFARVP